MDLLNNRTLKALLLSGNLTQARLDDAATRVLTPLFRVGLMDHPNTRGNLSANVTTALSAEVARQVAEESAVLLQNKGNLLPLKRGMKVLLAGSTSPAVGGWGSGSVGASHQPAFTAELGARLDPPTQRPNTLHNGNLDDPKNVAALQAADVVIAIVVTRSGEGADRANISFDAGCPHNWCAPRQDELVHNISQVAGNKTVVIALSTGTVLMPWADNVAAILMNFMPGQYYAPALVNVLFGDVAPSGKLPVTIPNKENEYGWSQSQFPGVQNPPCPPRARNCAPPVVTYTEGLFLGYRWYDQRGIAPRFCFGHGLGYTSFAFSELKTVAGAAGGATVTAVVRNSGNATGREVAQLYLAFPGDDAFEPRSVLKGFNKTAMLQPGQSVTVEFSLSDRDLSWWLGGQWTKQTGDFGIMVGSSSRDLRLNGTLAITE